jgi:hypothetical protein
MRSKKAVVFMSLAFSGIPLYIKLFYFLGKKYFVHLKNSMNNTATLFLTSSLVLYFLCGLIIPFNVVASDPAEFSFITNNPSPFSMLFFPITVALGLFVFWPVYLFYLSSNKVKTIFAFIMSFLAITGIINTFVFQGSYGMLSETLVFPLGTDFSGSRMFMTGSLIAVLAVFSLIVFLFLCDKVRILATLLTVFLIGGASIVIWKTTDIQKQYNEYKIIFMGEDKPQNTVPVFSLSQMGQNVVIIMLDRAVGSYVPFVFDDLAYLKRSFDGFTYYPNTVSFYGSTILGIPPLLGGYEYTPEQLHERKNDLMVTKHNEAIMVLPELFKNTGYRASVFDIPYVNYQVLSDTFFFTSKGIDSKNLEGNYSKIFLEELGDDAPFIMKTETALRRNFIMYSIFSIVPPVLRSVVYRDGSYWSATGNELLDIIETINNYAVLHYLPELTDITETGDNLVILANQLTHKASFLQYPDYTVTSKVTNFGPDFFNGDDFSRQNYHVQAASYVRLSKWFETLRARNVYDNTRIIIVSDHDTQCVKPLFSEKLNDIVTDYNPVLLFKDFNMHGELKTDNSFMTNADTPLLATTNLLQNSKNPFTGKELVADKENGVNIYLGSASQKNGFSSWRALDKVSSFYHVHDNIFAEENWTSFTREYND